MSGGAAGGSSQGSVVRVVGNVPACVPGGGDASLADLQIGIDNANHYVVPIRQIVQCARDAGERAAQTACQNRGSDLARHLGHLDALGMAMWGKHNQCTCNVKHVETVLDWAVEHYGGVLQEEATKETSMLTLEMLLKEVFFRDASENLARALGIAGGVFDTARWPDAVIAQADV